MPSADGKADWQSGVRTGAYVIEKFEPGVKTTLKKYPNYYRTDRGHFDSAEVLSIIDVAARTNALTSGEVHYIDRPDLKTLHLLKRNQSIKILEVVGYGHYVFVMNVTVPPFDNVDVRTALKYSLDREDIVKKVFLGHGQVGNDNPIAPSLKFAIDPEPKHVYDPEKAKSYLTKAGFETLKVDLSASDAAFANCVDAAVLWKEHATKAGIELNVIREPNDGYWVNVWLRKPFCGSFWVGRPTCDWMFTIAYAADAAWNDTFWKNPRFNELLLQGRSETDEVKRAAIYAEMQQLVHDDGGLVNLVFNSYVSAHDAKLGHEEVAPNLPDDGARLIERWWFEA
jgi:peptide/nickel transport system substrate-binding protein